MAENVPAKIRKRRLALALATGLSVKDAAEQAGVCEKTAHRALRNPLFVRRVRRIHAEMRERVVGALTDASTAAVAALKDMLKEGTPATARVSAARALLEFSGKMSLELQLSERVAALEAEKEARNDEEPAS